MDRIAQISKFLTETPLDPFLNYALALEYIKINELEKAEELFLKLIQNTPLYVATYYHYGKLLEGEKRNEAALKMYKQGIEISKQTGEQHQLSELQTAFVNLEMIDLL